MKVSFDGSVSEVMGEIQEFMETVSSTGAKRIDTPVMKTKKMDKKVNQEKTEAASEYKPADESEKKSIEFTPTIPTVPTVTTEYTLTDVTNAAAQLVRDKGEAMRIKLAELLKKFGVKSLPELDSSNFGAVMEELKNLGADV